MNKIRSLFIREISTGQVSIGSTTFAHSVTPSDLQLNFVKLRNDKLGTYKTFNNSFSPSVKTKQQTIERRMAAEQRQRDGKQGK